MEVLSEIQELVTQASQMGHFTHLQRVKSETAFKELFSTLKTKLSASELTYIVNIIGETLILMMSSQKWENKFGGINIAIYLTLEGLASDELTNRIVE